MNTIHSSWSPNQTKLINMVQQYPILYTKNRTMSINDYNTALQIAWKDISSKCFLPLRWCKQSWTDLQSRYAKLKMLINTGTITEEIVQGKPEARKYLDGCLSFLDPYLCEVEISPSVNNQYNKMFVNVDSSCDNIEYILPDEQIPSVENIHNPLMNVRDNTPTHSQGNLEATTNTIKRTYDRVALGLESELVIEDVKLEDDDEVIEVQMLDVDEQIIPDTIVVDSTEEDTNDKTMMDIDVPTDRSDDDDFMLKFFTELGNVMSREMSQEKQKRSRMRINALVQEILDEESLLQD